MTLLLLGNVASVISGVATVVLAILTFIYVRLTKTILENQSNPCVIVSVVHVSEGFGLLQLVIKNVGAGLAQDIAFDLSRPIPALAFGHIERDAKTVEPMKSGPLIEGVPALAPGEERRIDWGQYGGLMKNLGMEPVIVTCRFKKNGKWMHPTQCKLDVKSFEGTTDRSSPSATVAKELVNISREIKNLVVVVRELKTEIAGGQDFTSEVDKESEA